jgi:hypothetical protein
MSKEKQLTKKERMEKARELLKELGELQIPLQELEKIGGGSQSIFNGCSNTCLSKSQNDVGPR